MKPEVKSILRVGSTRSLDSAIGTEASCRRADLKRSVSFSMASRWQDGSGDESDRSRQKNTRPMESGIRMPVRRMDDDEDDDDSSSTCTHIRSNCSSCVDKGLRMHIRREDPPCDQDEENTPEEHSSKDNAPTHPERKSTPVKARALRVPARNTFSGDKGWSLGVALEMRELPFAGSKSEGFNALMRKSPMMSGIHSTDIQRNGGGATTA